MEQERKAEKTVYKIPNDFILAWEEIMTCTALIREGKARIVTVTGKDGSTYRYTKLRKIK